MNRTPPRGDIVKALADAMLNAIEDSNVDDLTIGEVVSAVFTLCNHVTTVLLEEGDAASIAHNKSQIADAIGGIYAKLNLTVN
jgi:hypothetical protein